MKKIYFFNGWGMDDSILSNIENSTEYTIEIVNFPYVIDIKELSKKQDIIFIAWSFGVYYLNKFLNQNKNIKYHKAIAINGVPEIIGEYGINEKMFNLTLSTLNPENLLKFYKNMDIDETFKYSSKKFEEIKKELLFFKENYTMFEMNKIDYIFIGKYDRIIPRAKQEKFCKEKNSTYEIIDCGHYPFSYFKDFSNIIKV